MVAYRTPSQHATARLFCLPHAGGTAQTFLRWRKYVPAWIDLCAIELPGRARRIDEPQPRDVDAVVAEFLDNSRDLLDLPYAVFGHSLGGLLAYQITRTVEETGRPALVRLYVSATRPPADEATAPRRHQLGDRELAAHLRDIGGTPAEVLEDEALLSLVLPIIRSDLRLGETYRHTWTQPQRTPITAFAGIDDPVVSPHQAAGWLAYSDGGVAVRELPGDHFFLDEKAREIVATIAADLTVAVHAGVPPG